MSLWLLLIAHMVADFMLQSADLAVKKTQHFRYLAGHAAVYALTIAAAAFVCIPAAVAWVPVVIIAITHFLIDWIRVCVDKKLKTPEQLFVSFVVDQLLHTGIIWVSVRAFGLNANISPWLAELASGEPVEQILRYVLIFVIILDPASVFVKKISAIVPSGTGKGQKQENAAPPSGTDDAQEQETASGPGEADDRKQDASVGDLIGKLERILTVILVLSNEIRAIGFVLTAKSLARSKQLDDPGFAERYLIGTLASNAIAIIAALMLK